MLQRQMEQLKDMFIDLNMLVERQGEQIDNIEFQVNMAGDYMEKGIKQLDSAKKSLSRIAFSFKNLVANHHTSSSYCSPCGAQTWPCFVFGAWIPGCFDSPP